MKNRNCPNKDACWDYDVSNCDGCAIGEKIARLVRQNKKLKMQQARIDYLECRAAVAERALLIVVDEYKCEECPCQVCDDSICIGLIIKKYKEKAEREFVEGRK